MMNNGGEGILNKIQDVSQLQYHGSIRHILLAISRLPLQMS